MEISNDAIPADDILELYSLQSDETKTAISNIIGSSGNFISVSFAGTTPNGTPMVHVDWKANPQMSIMLFAAAVDIGKKRFGETWLSALMHTLIQQDRHE